MLRGIDPYKVAPRFKVSCKRPGRRRVGPGSGWVGLFDMMGSAHTPICLQKVLSCTFLQGSLCLGVVGKHLDSVHRRMHILLIRLHIVIMQMSIVLKCFI